jgi:hypothetical protein
VSAFAFEGDGHPVPRPPDGEIARELCGQLHELALRYWSEGRPADAFRVAMEATTILDLFDPPPDFVAEVRATVKAVGRELLGPPGPDQRSE